MNIDEARKRAAELGELAAADPDFRKRMESDPRGTMIEQGIPEALVDDILEPDFEGHGYTMPAPGTTRLCASALCPPQTSNCAAATSSCSSTVKDRGGKCIQG